jgi:CheY-like chemotaxis protein
MFGGPVALALKATLGLLPVEFVEMPTEANMLIAERARDMAEHYSSEKYFVIFAQNNVGDQKAKNVFEYNPLETVKLLELVARLSQLNLPKPEIEEIEFRYERPGRKRVLVVDDTLCHQWSAALLLADYDLTIARGFDEALALLENNTYEIVLTDMQMPMSTKGALSSFVLGGLVTYGLLIANEAARLGTKCVAVVTDLNHHTDPFSAAFDIIGKYCYDINGAKVRYLHSPMITMDGKIVKDWLSVIKKIEGGE